MKKKSWVALLIEDELFRIVESIDDIIADGSILDMKDNHITQAIHDALPKVRDISNLTDAFASEAYMSSILHGCERHKLKQKVDGLYERYPQDFDALMLYGHDCVNTGIAANHARNPADGFGRIHALRNTIFTMAYLVSGDRKYLNTLNQTASLESIKPLAYHSEFQLDGMVSRFDNSTYTLLSNLVKNADRHKAKHINIKLSDNGPQYVVSDDGAGIAQENLRHIFGKYSSTGGGLGLRIAARIAKMKWGHISVDSTIEGKDTYRFDTKLNRLRKVKQQSVGTTFSVYFSQ